MVSIMVKQSLRNRLLPILAALLLISLSLTFYNREIVAQKWRENAPNLIPSFKNPEEHRDEVKDEVKEDHKEAHAPWVYKPVPTDVVEAPPIVDNFPSASTGLPPIPAWNAPPTTHVKEMTPLLLGFTRNWRILQQAVVSYITAGWPASDIYVIENTGVMDNNKQGRLSLQNPFFLNYTRLEQLGVNVVRTPTLLNFAQLQNFYINFAVEKNLKGYFWGHMDVIAISDETEEKTVYTRALDVYRERFAPEMKEKWAAIWFAYDRLVLVKTEAYLDLGGWDTFIGYYMTDCDFHERIMMKDWIFPESHVGLIYDVGRSLDDLSVLYRQGAQRNDASYRELIATCDQIQIDKNDDKRGRNFWQGRQHGGAEDPFYRDPTAFEDGILSVIEQGKQLYSEKWGHQDCKLRESGLKLADAWKVEKDW